MFIEIVEAFRCPRPHELMWLVASADRLEDRDILAGELGGLAGDAVWRGAMGGAGRERAKAFDVKVHLPRLEAIYASL